MTLAQLRAMSAAELMQKAREIAKEEGWRIEERDDRVILIADNPDNGEPLLIDIGIVVDAFHTLMKRSILS
jgi:hypothetical protein